MTSPIPIILYGKTTQVGQNVINALKPDYEVIHFVQSTSRSITELPHLLNASTATTSPPPRTDSFDGESNIGSQDYSAPAQAIVLGGGASDDDVHALRDACKGLRDIPWLRPDLKVEMPPPTNPEYGRLMVKRCRTALDGLVERGEMEKDAIVWY